MDKKYTLSTLLSSSANVIKQFSHSLFPTYCTLCQKSTNENDYHLLLCRSCQEQIINYPEQCLFCQISPPLIEKGFTHLCPTCFNNSPLQGLTAPFYYQGTIKTLLQQLKLYKETALIPLIAHLIATHLQNVVNRAVSRYHQPLLLLPIPSDPFRVAGRGFTPAVEILKHLRGYLTPTRAHPVYNLLQKRAFILPQRDLNRQNRLTNLEAAFSIKKKHHSLIQGRHIFLFDDVIATGTTLNKVAELLQANGAASIQGFAIAGA